MGEQSGNYIAIPAQDGEDGFVELARTQSGRLFKKMILRQGTSFTHPSVPGKKITVDKNLADALVRNFNAGVCPIVQVPMVDDGNRHVEDPARNVGQVINLTSDDKGVYAMIDARKHADDFGKTLLGASALMHMNYEDTKTGDKKGPTLLHVAVTNRPYITDLDDFEEVVATSADTHGDSPVVWIPASNTEEKMELNEMLAALKSDHGIDVSALQEQAKGGQSELVTALSNVISTATGTEKTDEVLSLSDIANAVIELAEEKVALSGQIDALVERNEALALKDAEAEVDALVRQGKVLPKQRDVMVALSRTDRETFEALVPDNAIVSLSAQGVDTFDEPEASKKLADDINRLAALANGKTK